MQIEYNGAAALEENWRDFARRYTENGTAKNALLEVNLLNELVNTDITPAEFIAKHTDIGFTRLKEALDNVCRKQSDESGEKGPERDLNDYIPTQLVHKWIELLKSTGDSDLYPPPKSSSVPRTVKLKRDRIRGGESAGAILASAIHSACLKTIGGALKAATVNLAFAKGADFSIAHSEANKVFDNSLFIFDDTKGNQENNTGVRFKNHLFGRILKITTHKVLEGLPDKISLDAPSEHLDERTGHEKIADSKAISPFTAAAHSDQVAHILAIIERELNGQEGEIIKKHFGLGDDHKSYTLKELAKEYGTTDERVRQIKNKALRTIHSHADVVEDPPVRTRSTHVAGEPRAHVRVDTISATGIPIPLVPEIGAESLPPTRPDYPYLSLMPVEGEISDGALIRRKEAEAQHVTVMLTAGMPSAWTNKSGFYNDVFAQWQSILAVRKGIAAASILDEPEIQRRVIDLAVTLITHAPDGSHLEATFDPSKRDSAEGLSYNAVFKRFGHIDFNHPGQIVKALLYDPEPELRNEVTGYVARVPAALLSQQLHEIYKPRRFPKSAAFGDDLEAYVFCGGNNFKEFMQLYCKAKGFIKQWKGKNIYAADLLSQEKNLGIKPHDVARWMDDNTTIGLNSKNRAILIDAYSLNSKQIKCLELISGAIASLDTAENIINREDKILETQPGADTTLSAITVLKDLLAISYDSIENIVKKSGARLTGKTVYNWINRNRMGTEGIDTLLPYVKELSNALVPSDAALAQRAENLLLELPSSHPMPFHDSVMFARTQGYTIAECMDMLKCQMREPILEQWRKIHGDKRFLGWQAFKEYILKDKPPSIKLSSSTLDDMRLTGSEDLPESSAIDWIASKLGAKDEKDRIALRQLIYASPLDASQGKVDAAFDALEKAGDDKVVRYQAIKNMIDRIQERDGIRYRTDLAPRMIKHAHDIGLDMPTDVNPDSLYHTIQHMMARHVKSEKYGGIIAAYAFPNDQTRRERLSHLLTHDVKSTDSPDVLQERVEIAFDALQGNPIRENFDALLKAVNKREGLTEQLIKPLARTIQIYAAQNGIIPDEGNLTEVHIYYVFRTIYRERPTIDSPLRAKAIAAFIFQNDSDRRKALEALLTHTVGASQSFAGNVETDRAESRKVNGVG